MASCQLCIHISNCSKANSIHSYVSSVKRQEAAAEYEATQATIEAYG